jgi:hypothetical protein
MLSEPPRIGFCAIAVEDASAMAATAQKVLSHRLADERGLLGFKTRSRGILIGRNRPSLMILGGHLCVSSGRVVEMTPGVKDATTQDARGLPSSAELQAS